MGTATTEQALRQEAIRRRVRGECSRDICRDMGRSRRWLDKWWAIYRRHPTSDLADRSRAPQTSPNQVAPEIASAVVRLRKLLEAAATPTTRYSPIGARAIAGQLAEWAIAPIPSLSSIQRILQAEGLTHPLGAGEAKAYYPWPIAWEVNAIQATDIITRHVRGGLAVENFHTIDHFSQAIWLGPSDNQTAATTRQFLLENWAHLGLPHLHQFDNAGAFCGGHTHARVIGQVVRLCLFCGIEPLFTPFYDPRRNWQIETFHSLWLRLFWSRHQFRDLAHVQRLTPDFRAWYQAHYRPSALEGRTPQQVQQDAHIHWLTPKLQALIPAGRLPLTVGRIHFMRKVTGDGLIHLLNEPWPVDRKLAGEYVRATINVAEHRLTIWRQPDADSPWQQLKTRQFRLKEPIHDLLPAFRQKCARCPDYYPD
jgi:putative transposase